MYCFTCTYSGHLPIIAIEVDEQYTFSIRIISSVKQLWTLVLYISKNWFVKIQSIISLNMEPILVKKLRRRDS